MSTYIERALQKEISWLCEKMCSSMERVVETPLGGLSDSDAQRIYTEICVYSEILKRLQRIENGEVNA